MMDLFLPNGKTVWFIEKKETGEWIKFDSDYSKIEFTSNPHEALYFDTRMKAVGFLVSRHLMSEFYEIEYEFNN